MALRSQRVKLPASSEGTTTAVKITWQRRPPVVVEVQKKPEEELGIAIACLPDAAGVVIIDIRPRSAADRSAILQVGDVISQVNGRSLGYSTTEEALLVLSEESKAAVLRLNVSGEADLSSLPGDHPQPNDARRRNPAQHRAKTTVILPYLDTQSGACRAVAIIVFCFGILEGIARVMFERLNGLVHRDMELEEKDKINFCFDVIMFFWYEWIWRDETGGLVRQS
ncbi:uncharacterized protein MONBRDRAFT_11502 [Monosiga brevicollis MX1]|uniref:PDZ domain-containing protein n=1 Tax=Monosiga brevicollis TaxID=81824 RepID=A9V9C4_MONBE|nr:uncharacterized protein MONBRDRAFT_11502 [Monosiga brevicollis MX1]EDQ85905.1 predicted protein [Monosiga brevicollis MX1]|eukprot:XP_001749384.1 hypothetical protein [Monosiga brevicollis MX1]